MRTDRYVAAEAASVRERVVLRIVGSFRFEKP
jgi:hypothetical protein